MYKDYQSTINGKKRKRKKGESCITLSLKSEEIKQSPNDMLTLLTRENKELRESLAFPAAKSYSFFEASGPPY